MENLAWACWCSTKHTW